MERHETSWAVEGARLSSDAAAELEDRLKSDPSDHKTRVRLLGFYFTKTEVRQKRHEHALWITTHAPETEIAGTPYVALHSRIDGKAYETAADLWKKYVTSDDARPLLLGNAAQFFLISDKRLAEELLQRAAAQEPSNPRWVRKLAHLYLLEAPTAESSQGAYQRAWATFDRCEPYASDTDEWISWGNSASKAALGAGEPEQAARIASGLLETGSKGNAVHHGNNILGLIALSEGNVEEAKDHLIAAGQTEGSAQLDSFGPNMQLAKALLERGEAGVVVEYLELCERFWPRPPLDQWKDQVSRGEVPDFGANLRY